MSPLIFTILVKVNFFSCNHISMFSQQLSLGDGHDSI